MEEIKKLKMELLDIREQLKVTTDYEVHRLLKRQSLLLSSRIDQLSRENS